VIERGDEARALARLPLSLLRPSEELAATFDSWGIRTFGDLSRLPETGLAERLGQEGVQLHRLARGLSPDPVKPEREPRVFESAFEPGHSVDSLESLAFLLARLLNDVCGELVRHGLAAAGLILRLALENRTEYVRSIRLPFASTDASTFLKLLQYDLAAHPPAAAIVRVALCAEPAAQRRLQSGLFIPVAPEAQKLEVTLVRLTAVVGEGNAGSPELLNTHRPDAFRINRFTAGTDAHVKPAPVAAAYPPLAIRFFRPPLPAEVAAHQGVPAAVRARGIRGDVIGYAGPWRTSGDWWRSDQWARDEWDIALDCGALYRIFCERDERWFVGGNYD
jgi:protein ImuB